MRVCFRNQKRVKATFVGHDLNRISVFQIERYSALNEPKKPVDMSELVDRLRGVVQRIDELAPGNPSPVRLIAVSKTKPVENILELYRAGQRYFGENYVDELESKANDPAIVEQCPDIRWHLIGHLQSNKVNRVLTRVPNLDCIQTVDTIELATRLNTNLQQQSKHLNILLQVNTSQEEQKYGVKPDQFLAVYEHIKNNCPQLMCHGLMTIGSMDNVNADDDSDFHVLVRCREELCEKFQLPVQGMDLSMGMSHDYARAILAGSTFVRVGSLIFGSR